MKSLRFAKTAVILVAASLILSSCGESPSSQSSSRGASSAVQGSASSSSGDAGGKNLRVVASKPSVLEDMNTNATSLWLEETTGIHVVYDQIPQENVNEKVAMMLAGGDLPDIFLNCGITSAQINQYGIQDEVLIPLDDLIGQYGTNLKKAMEPFPQGFDLIREVDGKIYSLPTINPCFHCSRALKMWLNDEWMQKLNLSYPTTTDEFYNVMKAFRDNDPNGNGEKDEIPLAGSTDGWYTQSAYFLVNSFLPFDAYQQGFGLDDNGNVVNRMTDEAFRDALEYLHTLYADGVLYEGTLTQKNDQLKKLVENPDAPLVGATCGGYGGQFTTELGGERYRMYRPLSPLKGPEGVQYAGSFLQTPTVGAFVVTKDCSDPALAVQWGDAFYTHEATATVFNGVEGTAWRYAQEGETGFNGKPALWAALISYGGDVGGTRNDCWTQMGIYNFSDTWRGGQAVDKDIDLWSADGMEYMLFKETQELYDPYGMDQYILPVLKLADEENTKVTSLRTELNNYFSEMFFNFVTGAWNLETDWDTHVEKLQTVYNLPAMLEIYQSAYDRSAAK